MSSSRNTSGRNSGRSTCSTGSSSSGPGSTSSSSSGDNSPSLARSRWGLLQQAILKKTIPDTTGNPASKRVFERYSDLVNWTTNQNNKMMMVLVDIPSPMAILSATAMEPDQKLLTSKPGYIVFEKQDKAKLPLMSPTQALNLNLDHCTAKYPIEVHRKHGPVSVDIQHLKGFDKTGRICIWPSEQILTYWSLKNKKVYEGKKVIEIGGGFHCLAGLALAKYSKAEKVVLTDGDDVNVEDVTFSIERNNITAEKCHATTLRWSDFRTKPEFESVFDIVIAADVVYESSTFGDLLETITFVLKSGGQFILFNPTRDGMLQDFVSLAQSGNAFSDVKFNEHYDPLVTKIGRELIAYNIAFNWDWHYPNQVIFKKAAKPAPKPEQL